MSADLFAEFASEPRKNQGQDTASQPQPVSKSSTNFSFFDSLNAAPAPVPQPQHVHQQQQLENLTWNQASVVPTDDNDEWGDFEGGPSTFESAPAIAQDPFAFASTPAAQPQLSTAPAVGSTSHDPFGHNLQYSSQSNPDPWQKTQSIKAKKCADSSVLFDAEESLDNDDDFGDFEEAAATFDMAASAPTNDASSALVDLLGDLDVSQPQPKVLSPVGRHMDTVSRDAPFTSRLKKSAVGGFGKVQKHSQSISSGQPEARAKEAAWETFDDWEASVPTQTGVNRSTKRISPKAVSREANEVPAPMLSPGRDSAQAGELPPTNVPPPGVLLSLLAPLFTDAQEKLFKPMAGQTLPMRNRVMAEPATIRYLQGYLALGNVAAHIIAGRKLRWKRDQHLSQGMRMGPASSRATSGMKLTGIDKGENVKEEREVSEVVRVWKEQVGRLRHVVSGANQIKAGTLGAVPDVHETMAVRALRQDEGGIPARVPCMVCGLKREERVTATDLATDDSFGEWWIEQVNMHRGSHPLPHDARRDGLSPVDDAALAPTQSPSTLLRPRGPPAIDTGKRTSFDAAQLERMARSPIVPEHDHGMGASGLRRIRQQGGSRLLPPTQRSASLNSATPPVARHASDAAPPAPASPTLAFGEDLSRFPSESLHSFSFATQSEEFIHNRQNVLKRSIDFMRDRLGWAATNPAIANAQAKLSGDHEVQSMLELLSRANLIGHDSAGAHGLAALGPITGPADMSPDNLFDKHFAIAERSDSPESMLDTAQPRAHGAASSDAESASASACPSHSALAQTRDASPPPARRRQRAALKRTLTDVVPLTIQSQLNDVLAQPYSVADQGHVHQLVSVPTIPPSFSNVPGPHSAGSAPHGYGSRYTPAAQAIFTTEAHSPWTITSANDLACLVFGVTRAEVRKLGILEVVRADRRKWLEEKLRNPDIGSKTTSRDGPNPALNQATNMKVGAGVTARLLSKPSSRVVAARKAKTDDGSGSSYYNAKKAGKLNHESKGSRGVLLCGDVIPIQKRNGATGSASLWVKEKRGGLIWVLEEIAEDVVYINVDEVGCVLKGWGAIDAVFGSDRLRRGMDLKRLLPGIPRLKGTNTGGLDYDEIAAVLSYTARTSNSINIPVTVESIPGELTFRVSSFPHIAGIIVLSSSDLRVTSSNSVFSAALFGQPRPEGLHIAKLIPAFDKILHVMTDEDKIDLVDGIVIPEHSFRRARALLAMREGSADAAAIFLRPSGLPALHRDGSEIMVDVQMRVVKSETTPPPPRFDENVIEEEDAPAKQKKKDPQLVYALWITYSRQLHAANHGIGPVTPLLSRPGTPPRQPEPGQSNLNFPEELFLSESSTSSSSTPHHASLLLTRQLQATTTTTQAHARRDTVPSMAPPPASAAKKEDPPPKKTINDFVVLEEMGQGAYGQVKLCRFKKNSNKKVVMKYVTKRRILVDTWTRDRRLGTVPLEIHVLDYLRRDGFRHPNIVEMSDFFEDDINYYIEMVPHGLPGMDLFDYIELRVNMEENECRKIFIQIASAVHHLHTKAKVVHRDIKDENVVLDGEGNIKLIDFGSAAYIKSGPFDVFVGTIDYAAPEVLGGQEYRGKEQDIWALGILLYTIIYKENPFYSVDEIMEHDLRVPWVMSEESIDLVRLMLDRDVEKRITISQVLEHPWCSGNVAASKG
ncbi:serine/threonine protein kinase [Pleosporales sp. CAS-2024a]